MSFWKKKNQDSSEDSEIQGSDSAVNAENKADLRPAEIKTAAPQQTENSESSFIGAIQQQDNTYSKIRSALSAGTVIQGKLSFDTPVRIDGKLSGEVYSSKVLIVGETAQISATIEASSLIILGQVKGTIVASEKVQLCSGSVVEGNIKSPSLVIESGASFNGKSEMGSSEKSKPAFDTKETKIYSNENVDLEAMLNKASKSDDTAKNKPESKQETRPGL